MENLADFRRLAQAACLRVGSLLNQAELGRDAGLSQPQVQRGWRRFSTSTLIAATAGSCSTAATTSFP